MIHFISSMREGAGKDRTFYLSLPDETEVAFFPSGLGFGLRVDLSTPDFFTLFKIFKFKKNLDIALKKSKEIAIQNQLYRI